MTICKNEQERVGFTSIALFFVDKQHGLYCKRREMLYATVPTTIDAHHPFLEPASAARQCRSGSAGGDGPAGVTSRHHAGNTPPAQRKLPPHRRQCPPRPGCAGHQPYVPSARSPARDGTRRDLLGGFSLAIPPAS